MMTIKIVRISRDNRVQPPAKILATPMQSYEYQKIKLKIQIVTIY